MTKLEKMLGKKLTRVSEVNMYMDMMGKLLKQHTDDFDLSDIFGDNEKMTDFYKCLKHIDVSNHGVLNEILQDLTEVKSSLLLEARRKNGSKELSLHRIGSFVDEVSSELHGVHFYYLSLPKKFADMFGLKQRTKYLELDHVLKARHDVLIVLVAKGLLPESTETRYDKNIYVRKDTLSQKKTYFVRYTKRSRVIFDGIEGKEFDTYEEAKAHADWVKQHVHELQDKARKKGSRIDGHPYRTTKSVDKGILEVNSHTGQPTYYIVRHLKPYVEKTGEGSKRFYTLEEAKAYRKQMVDDAAKKHDKK